MSDINIMLKQLESYIEMINSIFEIRLNPNKEQTIFENNKMIDVCKNLLKILDSISYNIYTIILPDRIVYIYRKDNMFYQFDMGHFNLRLKDMTFDCVIRKIEYNTITLDCRNNTDYDKIETRIINLKDFDSIIEDIDLYRIHTLDIFIL